MRELLLRAGTQLLDGAQGAERLGGLLDALATGLGGHLRHEEADGLALIDATLTQDQWRHFAAVHRDRIGGDAPRYLPWLLDQADPGTAARILDHMPEPVRAAYRDEWRDAYAGLTLYV